MLHAFRNTSLILLCAVAACCIASAQQRYPNNTSPQPNRTIEAQNGNTPHVKAVGESDKKFVKAAAVGDAFEVQMGQLAQKKSNNPAVKSFGQRMVKDHSQNDDLLKNLAQSQHVILPTHLDMKHQNQKAALSNLSGAKFDSAYMPLMVQDHQQTIQKFQKEAATGTDPVIKKYASESLPTLKSHLAEAQQVQGQVKQHPGQ